MVPCFRFVTKAVLITHQCFSCCLAVLAQCQALFSCSLCHPIWEAGGKHKAGRGHSQDCWPRRYYILYISYHIISYMTSSSAINLLEKKEGEMLRDMMFVFLSKHYVWKALLCQWKVVNEFLTLLCFCMQLLLYLLNCQSTSSHSFTFSNLSHQ